MSGKLSHHIFTVSTRCRTIGESKAIKVTAMAKHDVNLKLHTKVVANKDIEVEVKSDGSKLGTLLVSKGNLEWLPANKSVHKRRMSWERFAEVMETYGKSAR